MTCALQQWLSELWEQTAIQTAPEAALANTAILQLGPGVLQLNPIDLKVSPVPPALSATTEHRIALTPPRDATHSHSNWKQCQRDDSHSDGSVVHLQITLLMIAKGLLCTRHLLLEH